MTLLTLSFKYRSMFLLRVVMKRMHITCNLTHCIYLKFRPDSVYPGRMTVCLDLDDTLTLMKYGISC